MRRAVYPGSFDPVTNGHKDIIARAAQLFDTVIVLVSVNAGKHPSFSTTERVNMLLEITKDFENVRVDINDGLLVDYVKRVGAVAIVRGLRAVSGFEYEFQMALANKNLYDGAETVFLTTSTQNMYLSSSVVKEIACFGGDISHFVPESILGTITERLTNKK